MSIRRLHQKVPSLVFCCEPTRNVPSMISFHGRKQDVPPSIPKRKSSREYYADSFSTTSTQRCDDRSMANATFEIGNTSKSNAPTITMASLVDTLGCLSPLPKTPKRPTYRLTIQLPTKSDVAPTIPQRPSALSPSNNSEEITHEEEMNESTVLLNDQPNTKKRVDSTAVGDLLLNISNHSNHSYLSTSTRSTAWSNHRICKSYNILIPRI